MKKKDELSNPMSCLNRALDNERVFVLLERDVAAKVAIRAWVAERLRLRKNTLEDSEIIEALNWCHEPNDEPHVEGVLRGLRELGE